MTGVVVVIARALDTGDRPSHCARARARSLDNLLHPPRLPIKITRESLGPAALDAIRAADLERLLADATLDRFVTSLQGLNAPRLRLSDGLKLICKPPPPLRRRRSSSFARRSPQSSLGADPARGRGRRRWLVRRAWLGWSGTRLLLWNSTRLPHSEQQPSRETAVARSRGRARPRERARESARESA